MHGALYHACATLRAEEFAKDLERDASFDDEGGVVLAEEPYVRI